jgi:hydroxyacylglutathione hydrolase
MHIEKLVVGPVETNCYIVSKSADSNEVFIIDPGAEADRIIKAIGDRKVVATLLTHGHFDHTGALYAFSDYPIFINEKDAPMLNDFDLSAGRLMLDNNPRPEATNFYKEGDKLLLAGVEITIMETPGHTMGSVCIFAEDKIFTGDTLFDGDYGRTDLPGGSHELIRQSLRRLFTYEGYKIYPGHGPNAII